jgi:hypothetical protein
VGIGFASHVSPGKRTDWRKHATFTLLVVMGLVFWLPPLLRATVGDAGEAATVPDDSVPDDSVSHDSDHDTPISIGDFSGARPADADLFRAAPSRPAADAIVLTTTIIGKTRRAAVINGRLHREGDRIAVAGESFRLSSVADDRVELLRDGKDSRGGRPLILRMTPPHDGKK